MTKQTIYAGPEQLEAAMNRLIEGGNTTERTGARMLKATSPILKEIVHSGDLAQISGFVLGLCQIATSVVVSLPPFMRDGVIDIIKKQLDEKLEIARKGPPDARR